VAVPSKRSSGDCEKRIACSLPISAKRQVRVHQPPRTATTRASTE
jgi:hypothetical protein